MGAALDLLSRVPLLLWVILRRCLFLSPVRGKQTISTELMVTLIRSFINIKQPFLKMQEDSMKDPGIKSNMWISKVTLPKPGEDDIRDVLVKAIEYHNSGDERVDLPDVCGVEAEWTGYRKEAKKIPKLPELSESEKYKRLMEDVDGDSTILYFHGGTYILMDPCTHRDTTVKLAKLTSSRCLSVRYRLCPQNPFPAALLDALVVYFSLLSPPEGSNHTPVPANKIVLAGDSAGGNLAIGLLKTLLTMRRVVESQTVRFHGKQVPIDLPAGVAACSPWGDLTCSMQSFADNINLDYLPKPLNHGFNSTFTPLPFTPDSVWPLSPPRVDLTVNATMLAHPLLSVIRGSAEIWADSPPIFIQMGEEMLQDDGTYLSRKIHRGGAKVKFEVYEGKPHCFNMLLKGPVSRRAFTAWANFCADAIKGCTEGCGKAVYISPTGKEEREIKLDDIGSLTDDEVEKTIVNARNWLLAEENKLVEAHLKEKL